MLCLVFFFLDFLLLFLGILMFSFGFVFSFLLIKQHFCITYSFLQTSFLPFFFFLFQLLFNSFLLLNKVVYNVVLRVELLILYFFFDLRNIHPFTYTPLSLLIPTVMDLAEQSNFVLILQLILKIEIFSLYCLSYQIGLP